MWASLRNYYPVTTDCPLLGAVEFMGNSPVRVPGSAKGGKFMSVVVMPAVGYERNLS